MEKENQNENSNVYKMLELKEKYSSIGRYVLGVFNDAKVKRKILEDKWLKNRRQYDGIDDNPNFRKEVKDGRSKTYEKYTTLKVDQQRARLYELFNPTGDKNFSLFPSNNPQLPKSKVENIIYNLQAQYGTNLPKSVIEKAIKEIAEESALKLENKIEDYLEECNYSELIQNITLDAGIFGSGVLKGPLLKEKKETSYDLNEFGNWEVKTKTIEVPFFEYIPVWEWFPDLDAKNKEDIDFTILHQTQTKSSLLKLAEDKSYIKENIIDFIKTNPDGNFNYESYENQLISLSNESITIKPKKYRLVEFWGNVEAKLVKDILEIEEDAEVVSVNVVMLGDYVIKCVLNPFEGGKIPVHFFNLYTKGGQLTGGSLCDLLEEKQKQLNSTVRAKYDNMAQTATPMIEFNTDLILPQDMPDRFNPSRILMRHGMGDNANYPAIRSINIQNNINEFLSLEIQIKRDMDVISSLSGISTGDMSDVGKTLGRTSSGVSALMGGANTNLRDISKQFDSFTKEMLEMIIEIIYIIDEDEDYKGDFQVVPKVSTAIVEKQNNSNNLSAFVNQIQPEQRAMINWKEITKNQLLYNNLDPSFVMLTADEIEKQEEQRQLQQKQAMDMQMQVEQQKQALEIQKVQNDSVKAEGKKAVDLAKAQQILNSIEDLKNKGDLNTMLALHKIDIDNKSNDLKNQSLAHDVISKEIDRENNFTNDLISMRNTKKD